MRTTRETRDRLLLTATLCAVFLWSSAWADVTVRSVTDGKAMGIGAGGETVTYIKGPRMRMDDGDGTSTILDVDAQQMIVLNHKKKRAELVSMAEVSKSLSQISDSDVQVSVKPTGRSREILGETCYEHQVEIRMAFSPVPDEPMQMVMTGPFWVAPDSPARADFERFYTAVAEKGLFFGDPRLAKAQPGQAKGMAELYRAAAAAGVPYATELKIAFEGSGLMAKMMSRVAGSSFRNEVKSVSVEPLADGLFEVPAGYKIKK